MREQDEIGATAIHMNMLIAHNKEWEREFGLTYRHTDDTPTEVVEENSSSVNVFKGWVVATGGKTI